MIKLIESYGDIELKKFIIIFTKEIPGVGIMKYSNSLKCYYYIWKYKYNWHTMYHDPDTTHAETYYNIIPKEILNVSSENNVFVGGTSTYDGRGRFTFAAGLGTPLQQKKVKAFVEKVFPREFEMGEYTFEYESPFEFSL